MQTINKLLDTALKACNEPSDRQLAKHLDVSPSAISLWRKGKPIKDDHLMALIHLAQADPAIAVLVRTEGAESPEAKKAWSVVWDRLSPVTTVIGALALVAIGMHEGAHEALLAALSPVAVTHPLYIMRSSHIDAPVRPSDLSLLVPPQEADWTMTLDTYDRVDLTGPWAGFGFQGHRFFTPEGRDIDPVGMRYWSLTCNIAREWALMMAEERNARSGMAGNRCSAKVSNSSRSAGGNVIYLRDVLRRRREERSAGVDGAGAEAAPVGHIGRRRRRPRRG